MMLFLLVLVGVKTHLNLYRGWKLYGRGASDMKSAIAATIYAIKIVEELSEKLDLDLHGEVIIFITPDEETGGLAGAGYLVEKGII